MRDLFRIVPIYYNTKTRQSSQRLASLVENGCVVDASTVVEYLAFGTVWDAEATFFRDIRRVPPGATLRGGRVERLDGPVSFDLLDLPPHHMVSQFWSAFADAVERTAGRGESVVISLSGGLDSAAMAVAAVERLGADCVRAVTVGHRDDFDDPEPALASAICEHLGIEWAFIDADRSDATARWPQTEIWPTEPTPGAGVEWNRVVGEERVLWGLGGDSLMRGDRQHYAERLRRGEVFEAVADAVRTVALHGHRPGFGLSRLLRGEPAAFERPKWLVRDDGWDDIVQRRCELPKTWRRGFDELFAPVWSFQFESVAQVNAPDGPRYVFPFFDETFARFAARIPTAPWYIDKEILRAALRGRLPESVRLRPKTPVAGEQLTTLTRDGAIRVGAALSNAAEFVDVDLLASWLQPGVMRASELAPVLRAAGVGRWLAGLTVPR